MSRWFGFLITIVLGAAAGLFYGWRVSPVEYVDTTPDSLRIDYKSDYVLMVAEAYRVEANPEKAVRRLALLGDERPDDHIREALLFAERQGYSDTDVDQMRLLLTAVESYLLGLNPSGVSNP